MKLLEFQAKSLLAQFQIPVPPGRPAASAAEALQAAAALSLPVAVKAQVPVGGRGKAGGIAVAATADEVRREAERILSMRIKGFPVRRVLVEKAQHIQAEYYFSVMLDRSRRGLLAMASAAGGMDIEEVAASEPEKVAKLWLDARFPVADFQLRQLFYAAGFAAAQQRELLRVMRQVHQALMQSDALLVEINPLAITAEGQVLALDAKVEIDDNALFRHPDLAALERLDEGEHPLERRARQEGLAYVKLDGNIGVIGNGAGLVMASLDTLRQQGGRPANFCDLGGGARAEVVEKALALVLSDPDVQCVLINIFGGITRCDEVARGLANVLPRLGGRVPVVVRLAGTRHQEGLAVLRDLAVAGRPGSQEPVPGPGDPGAGAGAAGRLRSLQTAATLPEAAALAVKLAGQPPVEPAASREEGVQ